jgi:acyl carrier protein
MTDEEILRRISQVVAVTLDLELGQLAPSTTAADVPGWDSLANIQIVLGVEKAFGVRFRTGEIATMRNVGELVARTAALLTHRSA